MTFILIRKQINCVDRKQQIVILKRVVCVFIAGLQMCNQKRGLIYCRMPVLHAEISCALKRDNMTKFHTRLYYGATILAR